MDDEAMIDCVSIFSWRESSGAAAAAFLRTNGSGKGARHEIGLELFLETPEIWLH